MTARPDGLARGRTIERTGHRPEYSAAAQRTARRWPSNTAGSQMRARRRHASRTAAPRSPRWRAGRRSGASSTRAGAAPFAHAARAGCKPSSSGAVAAERRGPGGAQRLDRGGAAEIEAEFGLGRRSVSGARVAAACAGGGIRRRRRQVLRPERALLRAAAPSTAAHGGACSAGAAAARAARRRAGRRGTRGLLDAGDRAGDVVEVVFERRDAGQSAARGRRPARARFRPAGGLRRGIERARSA